MSNADVIKSIRRNNIQSAVMSFIGMMLAIPVSYALLSAIKPAEAIQQQQTPQQDGGYSQYASGYTQGYIANSTSTSEGGCKDNESSNNMDKRTGSSAAIPNQRSVTKEAWMKQIQNSYNEYKTITNTTNTTYNKNSNNTATSNVIVKDSNGAIVTTSTSAGGDSKNNVEVTNTQSNNPIVIDDSLNKAPQETTLVVKDVFSPDATLINDPSKKEISVTVEAPASGPKDDQHPTPKADEAVRTI